MNLTENKLRGWTVKYGSQQNVQELLDQYNNYVIRNEIIQEFNKAFNDMQSVVAEYRKEGNIGTNSSRNISSKRVANWTLVN